MAKRLGEFEIIETLLAPLADGFAGAMALSDDAALYTAADGHEIVITKDAVVEGVHFVENEVPEAVAARALRVNLSDLAAMGARPTAYFMALMLPARLGADWLGRFVDQLAADQDRYGISLAGGDTVSTPGPLSLSITALGEVPTGSALTRGGAQPGDGVYVSGTIGDATLGLAIVKGDLEIENAADREALIERYRMPAPRIDLGQGLRGVADAAIDVSDGLIADIAHIATGSGVGLELNIGMVPLSAPARRLSERDSSWVERLLTGGDDYELAFTAPTDATDRVADAANQGGVSVSLIGRVTDRSGVQLIGEGGVPRLFANRGWTHF